MKTKTIYVVSIVLLIASIIVGKIFLFPGKETATVRVAYQPIVFGMPVFAAEKNGLFKKNGVEVETMSFTSANDMLQSMVGGKTHIIPGSPLVPVVSLESQYPGRFRVFSHSIMTQEKPFDRILVKNQSSIQSPKDLEGKRLALLTGTTALNSLKAYFDKVGVDHSKIKFVQLAPPAWLPALESGSVDALYAYEPALTIALSKNSYRTITPSVYCSLLEPCPLVVSIIDRKFEKEHPEEAKKAIAAILEAVKAMRESPEESSLAMVDYTKIDPALAPKVSLQNMTLEGGMDPEQLQKFIDILTDIGELKNRIDAKRLIEPTK